jgi:hypothetical protein
LSGQELKKEFTANFGFFDTAEEMKVLKSSERCFGSRGFVVNCAGKAIL